MNRYSNQPILRTCNVCRKWFMAVAGSKYCSNGCHFRAHVLVADGCWCWTGSTNGIKNYGIFRMGRSGQKFYAHIFSYMLHKGVIPDKLQVLHRCDNPNCVKPSHLFLGTQDDNVKDMVGKGRHKYIAHLGEKNGNALLKTVDIIEIRRSTKTRRELAVQYGVTMRCIKAVRAKQNWKHVI